MPTLFPDRVFRSSQDILYLAGGSNSAASLYTEAGFSEAVNCIAWHERLTLRKTIVEQAGSRFLQLIVPEKLSVYPLDEGNRQKLFPGLQAHEIVPPGRRLLQIIGPTCVCYPEDFLREQSVHFPIYMPTDSHWTWQGAFSTFQALMWELGYTPDYNSFVGLSKKAFRYRADLWEPSFPDIEPDQFMRVCLPPSVRRVYVNPIVGMKEKMGLENEAGLHVGSHCVFENYAAEFQETVVIFGSSFSECRLDTSLLTACLSYYFRSVHFVWSTSVDVEYAVRHKPSLVIAEIPERFLTLCPDDKVRVEEYASERVRAWINRQV
jgi:alginate O-acetyltransferase complex protein AlgJ